MLERRVNHDGLGSVRFHISPDNKRPAFVLALLDAPPGPPLSVRRQATGHQRGSACCILPAYYRIAGGAEPQVCFRTSFASRAT